MNLTTTVEPSAHLQRYSEATMFLGITCVILGATIIVPVIVLILFCHVVDVCKKEWQPVPTNAIFGLVTAVLCGIAWAYVMGIVASH